MSKEEELALQDEFYNEIRPVLVKYTDRGLPVGACLEALIVLQVRGGRPYA